MTFYNEDTLPMMFTNIKKLREIIISEDLNLIHFHQVQINLFSPHQFWEWCQ
jgi:hypothetical protein